MTLIKAIVLPSIVARVFATMNIQLKNLNVSPFLGDVPGFTHPKFLIFFATKLNKDILNCDII